MNNNHLTDSLLVIVVIGLSLALCSRAATAQTVEYTLNPDSSLDVVVHAPPLGPTSGTTESIRVRTTLGVELGCYPLAPEQTMTFTTAPIAHSGTSFNVQAYAYTGQGCTGVKSPTSNIATVVLTPLALVLMPQGGE